MSRIFRIGVDPEWGRAGRVDPLVGAAFKELLDPVADVEWEIMPAAPTGIASPDVLERYDGVLILQLRFTPESFTGLKRTLCIARWGVGFDRIDIAAANEADIVVALTPTYIKRAVAEAVITLVFALAKQLPALDKRTREGRWRTDLPINGTDVVGKTLSSIGLGKIAGEMFKMARGIGFGRLLAYDPYCPGDRASELGVELVDLDTAMAEGDFVAVNTLLNDETRGMIDAGCFAKMKPTAYFINTSRGPIVDEAALIEALASSRIAGAGIDVFEQEPPPHDHPFFAMDNVIVAPHALAWTQEGLGGNSREACQNLLRVASGEVPPFLANPEAAERPGFQAKLSRWSRS